MQEQFLRTQMLLGTEALERLQNARVAVFGIGGVGGYTVEALARSGVGQLDLIDNDDVSVSNINRQILATHSTVGMPKVAAAKARILDINPGCVVRTHQIFYTPETADQFDFTQYDYVVDCIDTVTGKIELVIRANKLNIPVVGLVDTNCSPENIDYVIPGNDDAIRSVKLIAQVIANAVIEAKQGEALDLTVETTEENKEESIEEVVANSEEEIVEE